MDKDKRDVVDEEEYYQLTEKQRRYFYVKSIAGMIVGLVGLIVLSPVLLIIALAIKIEDGIHAPIIFSQKRVGVNGKHFKLYKFRSMKMDTPRDTATHLLRNPEKYITKVGKFLRKSSLDELPQLVNIAKGEMAVVGPRPALWNQDDLNALRESYGVHQLKPGLTGYAQITGRDELSIQDKAEKDSYYLKNFGVKQDIYCFFGTFLPVLRGDGIVEGREEHLEDE